MAYCTIQDVRDNHDRISKTKLEREIEGFIVDADAIIDAFISGKYSLPFASTPPLLKVISKNIATYFTLRRSFGAVTDDVQSWIAAYYDQSTEFLKQIRTCEMLLVDSSSTVLSIWDQITSNTQDAEAIFNLGDIYDLEYHSLLTTGVNDDRYGED